MNALRTSAAGAITRSTARVRGALVLVQAMMSVLLLVGAALFVRSLNHAINADLGFRPTLASCQTVCSCERRPHRPRCRGRNPA